MYVNRPTLKFITSNNMFESDQFANPPSKYKGTDFWMLDDALSDDEIDFPLSEMKAQGVASFIARTYIGLKSDYPGPGCKKRMRTIVECARKYGCPNLPSPGSGPSMKIHGKSSRTGRITVFRTQASG